MPIPIVISLIELLYDYLCGVRSTKIPPHCQVLSVLRFYATGSYQAVVAQDYLHSHGSLQTRISLTKMSTTLPTGK